MAPGGIADIANTGNVVTKRYGFLKLAKQTCTPVVPVWIPEERSYYSMWLPMGRVLERWLSYPVPMFIWGSRFFPLMPKRIATRIFVGDAIHMNETTDLDVAHAAFYSSIAKLQQLADEQMLSN